VRNYSVTTRHIECRDLWALNAISVTSGHCSNLSMVTFDWQEGTKVCRYNWHSAVSLGWPFPMLKYKYQVKYTAAILRNSTRKLLWFEITKMLTAVKKINLLCYLL